MAHLRGSSEAAEQLRSEIYSAAEKLKTLATEQSRALRSLEKSCRDNSYETMEYVLKQMILYIRSVMPDLLAVHNRLIAYRDLIESLDKPDGGAVRSLLKAKGYDKATQEQWIRSHRNAVVKQIGEQWSSGLSDQQRNSIRAYTGSAYADINATLRGLTRGFSSEDNFVCAKQIHSALQSSSIPCPCVVYRGMHSAALGELEHLSDDELTGCAYTDNGFMSTSLTPSDAFGGNVQLEIEVPKGAQGAYVGYISQQGHSEEEVLFDRGQYLQILEVRRDQFGRRIIRALMLL